MMTARVRWLVLPAVIGLFLGVLRGQSSLTVVSLSVLFWLLTEWLLFCWRVWYQLPRLEVRRLVNGRSQSTGVLWCGRPVRIELQVQSAVGQLQPLLQIRDVLPENIELLSLVPEAPGQPPDRPGGLFGSPQSAKSDMSNAGATSDSADSARIRPSDASRPGSSSNAPTGHQLTLLVASGDVAWSYHVRPRGAGRVMLPGVRFILQDANGFFRTERFVDLRQEFRVLPAFANAGTPQSLVKRINALPQHGIHRLQRSGMGSELLELREYVPGDPPKSIAWKVSARRDKLMTRQYESEVPVRVQFLVDGTLSTRVGGFGRRLLDQLIYVTASTARSAISAGDPVGAILFDERGQRRLAASGGDRSFFAILEALSDFAVPPPAPPLRLNSALLNSATNVCGERFPELMDDRFNQVPFTLFPLSPWKRRIRHVRTMLAGAFAEIFALEPAVQMRLIQDDGLMGLYMQHFLVLTGMAWMDPVLSPRERGEHDGLARMQMLSKAIRTAVAHARDNEVFVILSDLLNCTPAISHLLPALRMALGRHHRVAVVCPSSTFVRPTAAATAPGSDDADDLLLAAENLRNRDLQQRLNRELRRLGIPVAVSGEAAAVQMVMSEMELARTGRSAATGARR